MGSRVLVAAVGWIAILGAVPAACGQGLRSIEASASARRSAAVVVEDLPLVYTAQVLPFDGAVAGEGFSLAEQTRRAVERLLAVLAEADSGPTRLVKVNLVVARGEDGAAALRALAAALPDGVQPAVSLVQTALAHPQALVAIDAVAVAGEQPAGTEEVRRTRAAAVLPPGSRLFVSGQAEPGTLREATRKTLQSLSATLRHCGRSDRDVVQVKCFLQPMTAVYEVQEELVRYYGAEQAPPAVFVEWRSTAPIEIELVARAGPAAGPRVEYLTPPAMKASPVFSRVARVAGGRLVFFSDLFGPPEASADAQLEAAFENLNKLAERAGTDLKHLVKATYYVTDGEISRAHNAIRPRYYDPQRPPAASKAEVAGTGRAGVRYVMDMVGSAP
jgi:enamine deaminase RidA (YjgF/YER057c/UK114 family)